MPNAGAFLNAYGFARSAKKAGFLMRTKLASHTPVIRYEFYRYEFRLLFTPLRGGAGRRHLTTGQAAMNQRSDLSGRRHHTTFKRPSSSKQQSKNASTGTDAATLKRVVTGIARQRLTVYSAYGNPYQCAIGPISWSNLKDGSVLAVMQATAKKIHGR